MTPYKITSATLTTYSGKRHQVELETEYTTAPLHKVKEQLLDWFCKNHRQDPFVRIEVRTTKLLS